jgi:hypothetical protein
MRIESRADLEKYIGHFNNKEYERQIAYYAPDVNYKVGTLTLDSPRRIADFYADFHQHADEHIELVRYAQTGDTVAAAMCTRFEPFKDYERHGLSFKAGTVVEIVSLVFYTLKEGQIWRIRMARYAGPQSDWR